MNLGCQKKSEKKPQPSLPLLLRERQIQARMRIRRAKLAAAMKPVLSRRQKLLQHRVNVFIGGEGCWGRECQGGGEGRGKDPELRSSCIYLLNNSISDIL